MSALCILAAGGALLAAVPADRFTLSWTHSVEKTEWREDWRVGPSGLVLDRALVKGTGAGMEPPDGARLEEGWWAWRPSLPPQARVVLAASSFTADHTLCAAGACRPLRAWFGPSDEGPVELRACP